ncbi:MAG: universal stress protein [Chloroflexi bacterium]|nr:universal stress protein [Chloroflexota bacterium]
MHENILVPLDGSKIGEAALPYVEGLVSELAPGKKVTVTLLQVISLMPHYIIAGGEYDAAYPVVYSDKEIKQFKQEAADYLNKAGEGLRSKGANVNIIVATGQAADEILKVADEIKADLVAMSSHGRSGLSRWAFGSVADRVLRGSSQPVIVVRPPKEAKKK